MITPEWTTHSGQRIPLASMSDDHIRNVVLYLTRGDGEHGQMLRPGCSGFLNSEWLLLCAAELRRRQRHSASGT